MLNKIIKGGKGKKDTKKGTTNKKDPEEQTKEEDTQEQEQNTDLVDASQLKKDDKPKVKVSHNNRNEYQLQQKQVDIASLNEATMAKNQKPKQITSWVTNSVQEVMKKDFKMNNIDHEFMSLTDQELNKKLQQKQKQEQQKQKFVKTTEQNNLKITAFQKSRDQLMMEKADGDMQFSKPRIGVPSGTGISTSGPAVSFTNSNFNTPQTFKPIEKSAQELKMQEIERKQQQIAAKKPASWIGGNKKPAVQTPATTTTTEQKPVFKQSSWAMMATSTDNQAVGESIKFAPLNPKDMQKPDPVRKQSPKKEQPKKQYKKQEPKKQATWAASSAETQNNGIKFAPLQMSAQQQKFQQAGVRQEQEFVFVSKKEQQQRKKKREQRDNLMKAQNVPVPPK